ncbi:MAG: hypothetical protein AAFY66_05350 [Pseudomonadota bacterium]
MAIDIRAQPLADAIAELGRETGLQIGVTRSLARGRMSNAVAGTLTPMGLSGISCVGHGLSIFSQRS